MSFEKSSVIVHPTLTASYGGSTADACNLARARVDLSWLIVLSYAIEAQTTESWPVLWGLSLNMDGLEAAGDRFDEALSQMQKSLDAAVQRVDVALRRSDEELKNSAEEIVRLKEALADLQKRYDDLHAVSEVVSRRVDDTNAKVRSLMEG